MAMTLRLTTLKTLLNFIRKLLEKANKTSKPKVTKTQLDFNSMPDSLMLKFLCVLKLNDRDVKQKFFDEYPEFEKYKVTKEIE